MPVSNYVNGIGETRTSFSNYLKRSQKLKHEAMIFTFKIKKTIKKKQKIIILRRTVG